MAGGRPRGGAIVQKPSILPTRVSRVPDDDTFDYSAFLSEISGDDADETGQALIAYAESGRRAIISAEELASLAESQPVIRPQDGPQEQFLRCSADIAIYGGAAGGGKSYACLLEPLYHVDNPHFEAVLFRRTFKQITAPGGLWDRSMEIYPQVGGIPNFSRMEWRFPSGARVRFSHMQHEQDVISWKGSEIVLIEFDELTDFTEYQFFYMLSRNRSLSGIKPYMRGYTNPDSESWVKHLLAPWVDPTFPEPARPGEVRYFVREAGVMRWCEPDVPFAKSVTFVPATVWDNKLLMERDPSYLANLNALPELERQRLLLGSWVVRPSGMKFKREWFASHIIDEVPDDLVSVVRFWDLAATEAVEEGRLGRKQDMKDGPDYTAGVKVGVTSYGSYVILDAIWVRRSPHKIRQLIRETAIRDGIECQVWIEQEPGSGGVNTVDAYRREVLPDFDFHALPQSKKKLARANIAASHAEAGNVSLLRGYWNEGFLNFLMAFPNERVHDDPPDAWFSAMIILTTFAGSIPVEVSGRRRVVEAAANERMYQPAPQELSDEVREMLMQRQAMLRTILGQIRETPAIGSGFVEPPWEEMRGSTGGEWI